MTPVFYAYSTSNTTSAASVASPTAYISTMSFYVLAVETMYGRTLSPSASTVMSGITKGSGSGWVNI